MGKDRRKYVPGFLEALRFYTGITMRIGVSLLLGFLAGYGLDFKLKTRPWFALVGFFTGAGLGFWSIYDLVRLTFAQKRLKLKRRRRKR